MSSGPGLANGVELIYAHRTAVPVTRVSLSFDAGVVADPADALGTQNLMLSLLDEGTTSRDSIALAEARERLGASIGTGSSNDPAPPCGYRRPAPISPGRSICSPTSRAIRRSRRPRSSACAPRC